MIGRTGLVVGLLVLAVWVLWVRWAQDDPTPWQRMIGRRLLAVGLAILFVGAIARLVAHA